LAEVIGMSKAALEEMAEGLTPTEIFSIERGSSFA
jgi:hypothetical protein